MSKVIIDVTELSQWQGKLTGVPRVMDELSRKFANDADLKNEFVVWDSSISSYRMIRIDQELSLPVARMAKEEYSGDNLVRKLQLMIKLATNFLKRAKKSSQPNAIIGNDMFVKPQPGDILFIMADWHSSDPAFVSYIVKLHGEGVRLVQICYDLLPIVTPQYSGHATSTLIQYTKAVYPLCEDIFAISDHTKKDIKTWLKQNKLKAPPITVIRLGDDFKLSKPIVPKVDKFIKNHATFKNFILCVGTIEARKNHTLLYYAYKFAKQQDIDLPPLVIVGRRGWKSDDIYEIITNDPETKDKFIFLANASDEELAWLYKHCLFTVYPSFYEGWGLPIAESVFNGIPCIASNTSSMPEVAGDLINYFNPCSVDECLAAILNMLKPGAIDKAKLRLKTYEPTSWEDTFIKVKMIFMDL